MCLNPIDHKTSFVPCVMLAELNSGERESGVGGCFGVWCVFSACALAKTCPQWLTSLDEIITLRFIEFGELAGSTLGCGGMVRACARAVCGTGVVVDGPPPHCTTNRSRTLRLLLALLLVAAVVGCEAAGICSAWCALLVVVLGGVWKPLLVVCFVWLL